MNLPDVSVGPVAIEELQSILDVLKDQWPIAEIKLRAAILELQELRARASKPQEAVDSVTVSKADWDGLYNAMTEIKAHLINDLHEPGRSAFWISVKSIELMQAAEKSK